MNENSAHIRLAHGGGGSLTQALIEEEILPVIGNKTLNRLGDSAVLEPVEGQIALTTDSYVVQPLFFPGGDIGRLAVCGTVNDLAVSGAVPKWLSLGLILEEGLPVDDLRRILRSAKAAAEEACISIVTGDTKVVPRGDCDGCYINTAGVGVFSDSMKALPGRIEAGQALVINSDIGRHGMTIMTRRQSLGIESNMVSDVAPLNHLAQLMRQVCPGITAMRDATRGGLAGVLHELADSSKSTIIIDEAALPVDPAVKQSCDLLGFDALHVANEGVLVAAVPKTDADKLVDAMKKHARGARAAVVGEVTGGRGGVQLKTRLGTHRPVYPLSGEQLPRIC